MDNLREKVITGLECCVLRDPDDKRQCDDCPYRHPDGVITNSPCVNGLMGNALSLLKAQEPRVFDADEIVLSAEPSKWLWVERKGDYCAEAFKAGKTISGLIAFDSETPGAFLYCERPDEYGKTWRCWTSRPTDEQREEVNWE